MLERVPGEVIPVVPLRRRDHSDAGRKMSWASGKARKDKLLRSELRRQLRDGVAQLHLRLTDAQLDALLIYTDILSRWNRVYNLTAAQVPGEMVTRHLLDSLAVLPYVHGETLLDVGTGAGLPGLVLAVARPDLSCVLLDSNRKKTRFCLQAVAELGLANVQVVNARLEQYHPRTRYSSIIARAYSQTSEWLGEALRLSATGAKILLMKGTEADCSQVAAVRECAKVMALSVPGLNAQRHLLTFDADCLGRGTKWEKVRQRGRSR